MKQNRKIFLFAAFFALCALLTCGMAANAATHDAADAEAFAAAVENAAAGDTVRVTDSFTAGDAVTVDKNLTLTAENDATITVPNSFLIVDGASVRVTGKLNIVSENTTATEHLFKLTGTAPTLTIDLASTDYKIEGKTAHVGGTTYTESGVIFSNGTNATVNVAGGLVQNMGTGEMLKVLAGGTKFTWNVSGGKLYNTDSTGRIALSATPTELNITGGVIESRVQRVIQTNTTLDLTVSSGTITSLCGILFQSGGAMHATVEGGTITSTKAAATDGLFYMSGAGSSFTMTGGSISAGGTTAVQIKAGGTVNISAGVITAKTVADKWKGAIDVTGNCTLTMTGGSISVPTTASTQYGVVLRGGTDNVTFGGNASITAGYVAFDIAKDSPGSNTVTIGENASFTAKTYAAVCIQAQTTMTVNGGSFTTTTSGDGIYWWNAGTLTINDITVNGADTGIRCASVGGGTVDIKGGSITAKSSAAIYLNIGGVTLNVYDGAALTSTGSTGIYINHKGDPSAIHVYGGSISSSSNCFHITGGTETVTSITIDDGTFTTVKHRNIGHNLCSLTLVINGGNFTAGDYCVYSQGTATGTYTIKAAPSTPPPTPSTWAVRARRR